MSFSKFLRGDVLVALFFSGVFMLSAVAQTAPAPKQISPGSTASSDSKGPGAAKPGTKQSKMLDAALTPETRQTLQQAMDSAGNGKPSK